MKKTVQFVNYAHRGASSYAPENTMMSFYLGMQMGANGIETDIQLTRDGVPVLFHDDTLMRVTGETGAIADYTWEELQKFFVKKDGLVDKIVTFDDFLSHFAFRDITFALELKKQGTAQVVADMVRAYSIGEKCVITSFNFDELCRMRLCAPELETGFLTADVSADTLRLMKEKGITELCPEATLITKEAVDDWHKQGFRVRAWGVADEALMKSAYAAGVDGMTVNFPDKLAALINA